MSHTLVILAHPNLEQSIANRTIVEHLEQRDGVEIRHLHALYPDFKIDAQAEQEALLRADTIVLQFPFFWFSIPGILKHWMDEVLTYGFAYGSDGDKLHGKTLIVSTSIGGEEKSYQADGECSYTMGQLIYPIRETSNFIGTRWLDPVMSYGMAFIPGVAGDGAEVERRARDHVGRLLDQLAKLEAAALANV